MRVEAGPKGGLKINGRYVVKYEFRNKVRKRWSVYRNVVVRRGWRAQAEINQYRELHKGDRKYFSPVLAYWEESDDHDCNSWIAKLWVEDKDHKWSNDDIPDRVSSLLYMLVERYGLDDVPWDLKFNWVWNGKHPVIYDFES